jgi:hypothetical protein
LKPSEILAAHLASIDLSGAPGIELVLRGVDDEVTRHLIGKEEPVFSVSAHWLDVLDLIEGFGSIDAAMVDGRLKVSGDLIAALRWVPVVFSPTGSKRGPASSRRGS